MSEIDSPSHEVPVGYVVADQEFDMIINGEIRITLNPEDSRVDYFPPFDVYLLRGIDTDSGEPTAYFIRSRSYVDEIVETTGIPTTVRDNMTVREYSSLTRAIAAASDQNDILAGLDFATPDLDEEIPGSGPSAQMED